MQRRGRMAALVLTAGLTLSTVACTDETPTKPSELTDRTSTSASASQTAPSSASPSAPSEEEAVIAAYKSFFTVLTNVKDMSESSVRILLDPYGTGLAVDRLVEVAQMLSANGQRPAGKVIFAATEVEMESSASAVVRECRDTSTETIVDVTDGSVVSAGAPGTKFDAQLTKVDGAWKVSTYDAVEGAC